MAAHKGSGRRGLIVRHAAHMEISPTALKRLGLDQVWWIVTPGNLKDPSNLPSVAKRVAWRSV
jgi:nicotinic acid mononucleotide adenylyltransferase